MGKEALHTSALRVLLLSGICTVDPMTIACGPSDGRSHVPNLLQNVSPSSAAEQFLAYFKQTAAAVATSASPAAGFSSMLGGSGIALSPEMMPPAA